MEVVSTGGWTPNRLLIEVQTPVVEPDGQNSALLCPVYY